MSPERFGMLIGAMVFALKREATDAEVDEVFNRWDDIKISLRPAARRLDELDNVVASVISGDLGPAKALLAKCGLN